MSVVTDLLELANKPDSNPVLLHQRLRAYVRSSCSYQFKLPVRDRFEGDSFQMFCACGKCDNCRNSKANGLMTRLYLDARVLKHAYFVTLTYRGYGSIDEIPKPLRTIVWHQDRLNRTHNLEYAPCMLDYSHVQKFLKRLRSSYVRHHHRKLLMEYFSAGEYGHLYGRPHWHLVILSDSPISVAEFRRAWSWTDMDTLTTHFFGRIESDDLFANGTMSGINNLSASKCFKYVAKYCSKDSNDFCTSRLEMAWRVMKNNVFPKPRLDKFYIPSVPPLNFTKFYEKNLTDPKSLLRFQMRKDGDFAYSGRDYNALNLSFSQFKSIFKQCHHLSTGTCVGSLYFVANSERFLDGSKKLEKPQVVTSLKAAQETAPTPFKLSWPSFYSYLVRKSKERYRFYKKNVAGSTVVSQVDYKTAIPLLHELACISTSSLIHPVVSPGSSVCLEDFYIPFLSPSQEDALALYANTSASEFSTIGTEAHTITYSCLFDCVTREHFHLGVIIDQSGSPALTFEVFKYDRHERTYVFQRYQSIKTTLEALELQRDLNKDDWQICRDAIHDNYLLQSVLQSPSELCEQYKTEIDVNAEDWSAIRQKKTTEQINKPLSL